MKNNQANLNTTLTTLTDAELELVSGGDRGDAAVAGMIAGGAGGATLRGASWGARLGAFAGPVGAVAGGVGGALVGAGVYQLFK
ncbi:lactococcin A1 precursor [Acinetobacter shaoyimingii]|uniref:Lactococcin A1 n=1 Tax=Acinetobacter shaoyimingii TaxID=2715164 RepID=A0A6G8RV82_9GAMM|nr:lactococcin A1 precursor [Acinetobacter shaoyimingii]QIO05787.1 lactococcin A1 precursor [Acinetobacter shaoyimingii]